MIRLASRNCLHDTATDELFYGKQAGRYVLLLIYTVGVYKRKAMKRLNLFAGKTSALLTNDS